MKNKIKDTHSDGTEMRYGVDYDECFSNESSLSDLVEKIKDDSHIITHATNEIVNYLLKDEVKSYFECQSIEEQRGHILNALIMLIGKTTTNIQTHAYEELKWHWESYQCVGEIWNDLQENHFKILDSRIDDIKKKAYPKKSEILSKLSNKYDLDKEG